MTSNTLTDREALYCLCHVPGFGGVTIRGLKDTFGTYLSAWRVKPQELQKSGVLTERRAEVFQESRKHESAWRKEFGRPGTEEHPRHRGMRPGLSDPVSSI